VGGCREPRVGGHLLGRAAGRALWVLVTTRPDLVARRSDAFFRARSRQDRSSAPCRRRPCARSPRRCSADRAAGEAGDQLTESHRPAGRRLAALRRGARAPRRQGAGRDRRGDEFEAAIQVHLDALEDSAREAAAKLSVFGLVGWDGGLTGLGVHNANDVLRALSGAEVLVEQAQSRFRDTREWAFKHALMREVAYASLGEDMLKDCHARAGTWLAKMGEDDATVARHLELGGKSDAAAGYLEKAARRALAANALGQAVNLAERALAFADDKPSQFVARAHPRRSVGAPRRARRRARHRGARARGRRVRRGQRGPRARRPRALRGRARRVTARPPRASRRS